MARGNEKKITIRWCYEAVIIKCYIFRRNFIRGNRSVPDARSEKGIVGRSHYYRLLANKIYKGNSWLHARIDAPSRIFQWF